VFPDVLCIIAVISHRRFETE